MLLMSVDIVVDAHVAVLVVGVGPDEHRS